MNPRPDDWDRYARNQWHEAKEADPRGVRGASRDPGTGGQRPWASSKKKRLRSGCGGTLQRREAEGTAPP